MFNKSYEKENSVKWHDTKRGTLSAVRQDFLGAKLTMKLVDYRLNGTTLEEKEDRNMERREIRFSPPDISELEIEEVANALRTLVR